MESRTQERVERWDSRSFGGGRDELASLAAAEFSGAVTAVGTWLFMLNGRIVGVDGGDLEDFETSGTVYDAPDPALPLLAAMKTHDGETQAKYYTNETPMSAVDETLKSGSFTGYVELSEQVLSGDYYLVYYGGRRMAAAYVGNAERLFTGEEAFERAEDEVGIYEVVDVDVDVIDLRDEAGPTDADDERQADDSTSSAASVSDGRDDSRTPSSAPEAGSTPDERSNETGGTSVTFSADPDRVPDESTASADAGRTPAEPATDDVVDEITSDVDGLAEDASEITAGTDAGTESTTEPATDATGPTEPTTEGERDDARVDDHTPADDESEAPSSATQIPGALETEPHDGTADDDCTTDATAVSGTGATSDVDSTVVTDEPDTATTSATEVDPDTDASADTDDENADDEPKAEEEKDPSELKQRFEQEKRWRKTRRIPSIDPDNTDEPESSASPRAVSEQPPSTGEGRRSNQPTEQRDTDAGNPTGTQPLSDAKPTRGRGDVDSSGDASSGTGTDASEPVRTLRARIERLEQRHEAIESQRDELAAERDRLRSENQELSATIERLESRIDDLEAELERARSASEDATATADGPRLSPAEALAETNLFVRYESKGEPTLETAHAGDADASEVSTNLRLDRHTSFDDSGAVVDGDAYEEFLATTMEYRFVDWLVDELLYEIRDTGRSGGLQDLYDAIPRIDRAELDATISLADDDTEDVPDEVTFDVVAFDKMGNPLIVAALDDARDPASRDLLAGLEEAASAVKANYPDLAAAFAVTASYFEPGALEVSERATSGGLLSRSSKLNYVNLSRKAGYHLCLAEARSGGFHVTVPEL
ncbi:DUF7527 domain-containing protein [Natrialbaceae archaeon AArc-T1-2]|uniref:DUF7527 domain-containing protein n=1 Tax=Natrialbaceae archaeon AArc-T1-2 TaxID=3053904 RepID=UPI00255A8B53|nr:transcriptional regulator [Natrialbaceae archaeon AArc-T1-2]WIV66314.1 transcriptional regulator [Natrialbaceae archaeon AArc-T1-2]